MRFFNNLFGRMMSRVRVFGGAIVCSACMTCGEGSEAPAPAPSAPFDPAAATAYSWRPVAIGGGGFITGYDADRTGITRVIRTDVFGAYVWDSVQDRWTQLVTSAAMPDGDRAPSTKNEGVFEIVVAPSLPTRIYMAVDGLIYRSSNGGRTFERASTAGSPPFPLTFDANSEFRHYAPFMWVSHDNPDLVLLGTPLAGLWRTEDAGRTWTKVQSVPDGADIRPDAGVQSPGILVWNEPRQTGTASLVIWAMSYGRGVYRSTDLGRTFSPLAGSPTRLKQGAFSQDGAFFGVDAESQSVWLYRGGIWQDITRRVDPSRHRYASVVVRDKIGDVLVFDEGGLSFLSRDGGSSWFRLSHSSKAGTGDPPWLRVSNQSYFATGQVDADPVDPQRLWNSAGTGVYFADVPAGSGQIVWTSQTRGIEELVANDIVQAPGQAPLFAAWDFGIHRKEDLSQFSQIYGPRERVLIAAQQLDWSPSDPSFLVTNASDTRTFCCSEDGQAVLAGYSMDAGRTWTPFASLPTPPGTLPTDPWRMSFGTIAVSATDTSNIVWAPAFNRSPFFTRDRGRTWSRVVLPGERLPNTGSYANFYYKRKTLAADRVLPGTFYLAHSGDGDNVALAGLWRTSDAGTSWTRVWAGEVAPMSSISAKLRSVPGKAAHLFFTSGYLLGPDTALRRSLDGGQTWVIVPRVDGVLDIGFGKAAPGRDYPALFIVGKVSGVYGVWRSTDNAATWVRIGEFPVGSLDEIAVIEGDKDKFGRVYVGFGGSGFAYGEPSDCQAAPYRSGAGEECFAAC